MNVVITGATKGIGRATSLLLAEKGCNLFIHSRSEGDLDLLKQELLQRNPGIKVYYYAADLTDQSQLRALSVSVLSVFREIDVLINNAGIFRPGTIIGEQNENLELHMKTNFESAYHLSRLLLPNMLQKKSGHIINICSIANLKAYPGGSSYAISKFALYGFSQCLREELKPHGIKVTSVHPGATWTDSWKGADYPEERLMQASDIAIAINSAIEMGPGAVLEDIVIRPQLGDL